MLAAEQAVLKAMRDSHSELVDAIRKAQVIEGDTEEKVKKVLADVIDSFLSGKAYDPR